MTIMTITNYKKFKILLRKNWALQWNHKIELALELLLPIVFHVLLLIMRMKIAPIVVESIIYDNPLPIDNLNVLRSLQNLQEINIKFHLAYSPINPLWDDIVRDASALLNLSYSGYDNDRALEYGVFKEKYLAGIDFGNAMARIETYPIKLKYRLRFPSELRTDTSKEVKTWQTNVLYLDWDPQGPRNINDEDGGVPSGYMREGFLPIQNAIATAFLNRCKNSEFFNPWSNVYLQRYPFSKYIDDHFLFGLTKTMPLFILLNYIYPTSSIVKYVVMEKEKQVKEVMKMMGVHNLIHWMAWFAKAFQLMGLSSFLLITVLKISIWHAAILKHSSCTAVFLFFLLYNMSSITLCFMLASCFSKTTTAAPLTFICWIVSYLPYTFIESHFNTLTLRAKMAWSLITNTAMAFGVRIIINYESKGEGLQWNNLFSPMDSDEALSMGGVMVMMCLTTVFHLVICLYIEQINPGDFGIARDWDFPFKDEFLPESNSDDIEEDKINYRQYMPAAFENEPLNKEIGIRVINLSKEFDGKVAVNHFSLNIYQDEITVLLGHNGSGKTTTIAILAGLYPPTMGTAIINGYDILYELDEARASIGICPEHNILYDDLTVRDHLIFYSSLKGFSGNALDMEVNRFLTKINLADKANVESEKLSAGMKRTLSVCCALCGDSKIVICDEPSSNIDPSAKRQLWNLLQSEKRGRTILITTQFMDEADVLGDRIAIMSSGELKCYGTSHFLKKKYGSGYKLVCAKLPDCRTSDVTMFLRKYLPGLHALSDIGTELTYQLPVKFSNIFEKMFRDLETNLQELSLEGFGISTSSLEDVFMKMGTETILAERYQPSPDSQFEAYSSSEDSLSDVDSATSDIMFYEDQYLLSGNDLICSQWHSMMLKKYFYAIRNKKMFIVQNILPVFFIVTTIIGASMSNYAKLKPIELSLKQYPSTVTVLEVTSKVQANSLEKKISANYKAIIKATGSYHKLEDTGDTKFIDYILQRSFDLQLMVYYKYIASATIDNGRIIVWLNNKPLHTAPVSLNLVHNAIARTIIGPKASIEVINYPLPFSGASTYDLLKSGQNLGTQLALNLVLSMCFVSAFYALFLINENKSGAKLMQFIAGIRPITFWGTHLLWDLLSLTTTMLIVIFTIACFQEPGYESYAELGRMLIILFLFAFSVLPLTYLLSGLDAEPSKGSARLATINIFCSVGIFAVIFVMHVSGYKPEFAQYLIKIFLIFPHFALAQGLNDLYMNYKLRDICEHQFPISPHNYGGHSHLYCSYKPYFAWDPPGVLREVVYLIGTGFIFFILLVLKEYRLHRKLFHCIQFCKRKSPPDKEDMDEDVKRERDRIDKLSSSEMSGENLILQRVTKSYDGFVAVKQISMAVEVCECFGLLGMNGAGKTTIFKLLTGDLDISSGEAYIQGFNLKTNTYSVYKEIGYCPQYDALFDFLTGGETLRIFSMLRGIPPEYINPLIASVVNNFDFAEFRKKLVRVYSINNKRKLGVAVAMIGAPSIIFLDEPTTGMDPVARRKIWKALCRVREIGKSIVLTSHSMEECEALCTRLAIMVNGEFKCLGSIQHLKHRMGDGLILKIKVKMPTCNNANCDVDIYTMDLELKEHVETVIKFVKKKFPQAKLQQTLQQVIIFHISLSDIVWSKIFEVIESHKVALRIEDYSINQTTLEEIFMQLTKSQRIETRHFK